ncbi:ABC transporter permease [Thalassiella azotivora]
MTGLVGSLTEAWGEVRVHRARVVLSLVGVVLAVFAMTAVTAAGSIGRQVVLESAERMSGRATTVAVFAHPDGTTATTPDVATVLDDLVDRYGVEYSSTIREVWAPLPTAPGAPPLPGEHSEVTLRAVDVDYAVIHRIEPEAGRWLVPGDAERLAPAVVVNRTFVEAVGMDGVEPPFTVLLPGEPATSGTVVGVVDRNPWSAEAMLLPAAMDRLPADVVRNGSSPSLELWVPPDLVPTLRQEIPPLLAAQGLGGDVAPMSDESLAGMLTVIQWGVRVLSWFALGLGALGVLNVGVVTVRQRVREIGVRRALGASSGRVFAAVVLESVCATALAGLVGVALAVAVVVNVPLELLLGDYGISDIPPFPVSAAVEGLVTATVVGALAGLVPATMAVRAPVIDAIRY